MPPLDIQTIQTNTTEAKALLSYDQVVETLGMRVGIEGSLPSNAPGTTVNLDWQAPAEDGTPGGVLVHVIVDHNYVAPVVAAAVPPVSDVVGSTAASVVAPATPPAPPSDLAASIAAIAGTPTAAKPGA